MTPRADSDDAGVRPPTTREIIDAMQSPLPLLENPVVGPWLAQRAAERTNHARRPQLRVIKGGRDA